MKKLVSMLTALVVCFTFLIPARADAFWGNELIGDADIGVINAILINLGDFALQYYGVSTTIPDAVSNTITNDLQEALKQTEFGTQMLKIYNATFLATTAWVELGNAISQLDGARKQISEEALAKGRDCISSTLNEILMCYKLGEHDYKTGIIRTENEIKVLNFLAEKRELAKSLRETANSPLFWFWNRPDATDILGLADRLDFLIESTIDGSELYMQGYKNAETIAKANSSNTVGASPTFNLTAWPTGTLKQYDKFYCRGYITSNYPIIEASTYIIDSYGQRVQEKVIYPNKVKVNILDDGLDALKFGELGVGTYTLFFSANDSSGASNIWSSTFSISGEVTQPTQGQSTLAINMSVAPNGELKQGEKFYCRGTITSNYNITSVTTRITSSSGETLQTLTVYPNKTYVDILNDGLDELKFAQLASGSYTLTYTATDSSNMTAKEDYGFQVASPSENLHIFVSSEPTGQLPLGQPFYFRGYIQSGYQITEATVSINNINGYVIQTKTVYPQKTYVDILADGLDDLKFGTLSSGSYTLRLNVRDSSGATASWSSQTFVVG